MIAIWIFWYTTVVSCDNDGIEQSSRTDGKKNGKKIPLVRNNEGDGALCLPGTVHGENLHNPQRTNTINTHLDTDNPGNVFSSRMHEERGSNVEAFVPNTVRARKDSSTRLPMGLSTIIVLTITFSLERYSQLSDRQKALTESQEAQKAVAGVTIGLLTLSIIARTWNILVCLRPVKGHSTLTSPIRGLRVLSGEEYTPLNAIKLHVEALNGDSWDWWPLKPSFRRLESDEVRVVWRCVRGLH